MGCCEDILNKLCDELAEDIDSELCREVKQHLKECETCCREFESVKDTVHLFRCLEKSRVPDDIHRRLLTVLNLEKSES